jgi:hypothetical protein
MIATIAAELLHSASRKPMVSRPPCSPAAIFRIWSVMIVSTSGGATRPSSVRMSSISVSIGKKLARARIKRRAGKSAKKK